MRRRFTADAQQCNDARVLTRRDRHTARDDRRGDLGQVLALDSLGHVFSRRRGNLVPQHVASPASPAVSGRMAV
jgi:hypothetical protein